MKHRLYSVAHQGWISLSASTVGFCWTSARPEQMGHLNLCPPLSASPLVSSSSTTIILGNITTTFAFANRHLVEIDDILDRYTSLCAHRNISPSASRPHLSPPPNPPTMSKQFTANDVKEAGSVEKGLHIIIDNDVYEMGSFVDEHPGGAKILKRVGGKDASKQFWKVSGTRTLYGIGYSWRRCDKVRSVSGSLSSIDGRDRKVSMPCAATSLPDRIHYRSWTVARCSM